MLLQWQDNAGEVQCRPWGGSAVLGLAGDFRSNAVIGHFPAERKPSRRVISVDLTVPRWCPVYPLTTDIRTSAGFRRYGPWT